MLGLVFVKRLIARLLGKTAAERIKADKEAVTRAYELRVQKAEAAFSDGTKVIENEVKVEVEAIENSIALARRRLVSLNETGAVTGDHAERIKTALNGLPTH